jgi:hypothetical protein
VDIFSADGSARCAANPSQQIIMTLNSGSLTGAPGPAQPVATAIPDVATQTTGPASTAATPSAQPTLSVALPTAINVSPFPNGNSSSQTDQDRLASAINHTPGVVLAPAVPPRPSSHPPPIFADQRITSDMNRPLFLVQEPDPMSPAPPAYTVIPQVQITLATPSQQPLLSTPPLRILSPLR